MPSDAGALAFREAMSHLAAGVVIVTTQLDGQPWGMTVSACCSVSMSPPTLLVSLAEETASAKAIVETESFGVSLLGSRSIDVARFGATRGAPKFLAPYCAAAAASQSPVVAGAIAHVDCAAPRTVAVADHVLFIGEVRQVVLELGEEPLVYFDRAFRTLAASTPTDLLYTDW
jgi:flavin reductase ActVB